MEALFFLPPPSITNDPLDLLFHPQHRIGAPSTTFLTQAKADASSRGEFQHTVILRLDPQAGSKNCSINLCIKVICVGVLRDKLGNLDSGNKILV